MPRPRAPLILLPASGALPGADWLLRRGSRTGGARGRKWRIINKTATRQCGAGLPAAPPGRASEVLE